MRIVLDSNVLIPGLVVPGMCKEVVRHCLARHKVVLSEYILEEIKRKLVLKMKLSAGTTDALLEVLRERIVLVKPAALEESVCRDAKDIPVLGTAVAGAVKLLISGDQDLLVLGSFQGIAILPPAEFWRFERHGAQPNV